MFKKLALLFILTGIVAFLLIKFLPKSQTPKTITSDQPGNDEFIAEGQSLNPLTIEALRKTSYPGSKIKMEETLTAGNNYSQYIVSYISDGNKIFALMTVPSGDPSAGSGQVKPKNGWPVIIFNHGYIPPAEYRTAERYITYVDGFARNGYIVFKSDYRGHGDSEGAAGGAYGSSNYTIDVLNALASMRKFKDADPKRIGMWGHSMGGYITLRSMVVDKDIKAGVIWAGVVASYPDIVYNWKRSTFTPQPLPSGAKRWRDMLVSTYGTPEKNPEFWNSISANSYLKDISGPLQLHHGTSDASVPVEFSKKLEKQMKDAGKQVQLFTYEGDDHNLANNFNLAEQRSIDFFNKYLK